MRCYPQAYAAAVTRLKELMVYPRALIVDVGGFTADYLLMRNGGGRSVSMQFIGKWCHSAL